MVEFNSPLGRKKFAEQGSKKVLTIDDQSEFSEIDVPLQESQEKHRRMRWSEKNTTSIDENNGGYSKKILNDDISFEEIERRRKEAQLSRDRISPEAKRRLSILSDIGRLTGEVEIAGVKFSMQSMKSREQREIFELISNQSDMINTQFSIRSHTLARVITHIDGQELNLITGSNDPEVKALFLDEMDEAIVDFLYKWYQENIFKKGQKMYSLSTEEEVKEVVENIKK